MGSERRYVDSWDVTSVYAHEYSYTCMLRFPSRLIVFYMHHLHCQGSVGIEDLQLAVHLNLPLYSGEPDPISIFSSQSGSKRIFTSASIPYATCAYDIYDEHDLITQLSRLIIYNMEIQRWMIKIDDEYGGRGIAYLDTSTLKVIICTGYNMMMGEMVVVAHRCM